MLKVLASHIGLESTGYGRAFRSKDEIFRIVSINPNRSKCPINAERVADGRGFEFPTDNVAIRLSSVHAIRMYILCSFKKHRGRELAYASPPACALTHGAPASDDDE